MTAAAPSIPPADSSDKSARTRTPSAWQQTMAACVGAVLTSLVVTPLDVVKTRMQEQNHTASRGPGINERSSSTSQRGVERSTGTRRWPVSPLSATRPAIASPPTSIWVASTNIVRNEGLTALWRGLSPTLVMSVPGTVVYFVGYDRLRGYFARTMAPENVSYAPFVAGIIARSLAASIVSPVELVRTRMQTKEASGKSIQEVLSAVRAMTRQRGITYLWRGLSPTLWRDVPFSGIYWYCYESFKGYFGRKLEDAGVHTGVLSSNFSVPFLAGASAGILAATVTTPFDVAKTRRQISTASQPVILVDRFFDPSPATTSFATASASSWSTRSPPSNPVPVYSAPNTASSFLYDTNGVWTILRHIWQTEGASGLLRGLAPRVIKVAPSCAIMVSSYEFGKQIFEQGIPVE